MGEIELDTNVSLRILGDDVEPDRSHRKGDVHGTQRPVVRKQGYWSVTSSKHLDPSADTNDHIEWLVARVAPKLEQIAIYKRRGWIVDVWIAIHTSAGHGGPPLRPVVLAKLGALGLDVNLDLYPDA